MAQRNCYIFLTKNTIPVPAGAHREVPELRGPEELLHFPCENNNSVPAGAHREVPELRGPEELPLAQRGGVRQDSRVRRIQKRKKHNFMLLCTGTVHMEYFARG